LEKGYRFIESGGSFKDETAFVELGVGKNMADSIRYWCEMTGVTSEEELTPFAKSLFDEKNGWDPYLEDVASLWLLHWKLITNPFYFSSGTALFSHLHKSEFSKRDVAEAVLRYIDQTSQRAPSDNVIMRDVDCYVRTYSGKRRFEKKKKYEDSFDCPLRELGLIHPMNDGELYRFRIGPKHTLPAEIIGYCIWEYLHCRKKQHSFKIQEALYHEDSPGQVFMMDENSLIEAVNLLNGNPRWASEFSFSESAGIALIHCSLQDGNELLNSYYREGSVSS